MEGGRVKKRRDENGGEDRISQLSDDLIHHIMSFLNTKHAVQTCVLSKRWLPIWKSLPYLNFDVNTAPFGDNPEGKVTSFSRFIIRVCVRRARTNLTTVRFNSGGLTLNPSVIKLMQLHAQMYNVKELDIRAFCPKQIGFFTFKSLTTLKLESLGGQGYNLINLNLPALKYLILVGFSVRSQDFCPKIFYNFPKLESLRFVDNLFYGLEGLNIRAPNLKMLEFTFTCNGRFYPPRFKVVIDAPKLMEFKFEGCSPMLFSCSDDQLASLDEVYLDLKSDNDQEHEIHSLVNSFKAFRHAKQLTVSLQSIKALCKLLELLDESKLQFANLEVCEVNC